MSCCCCCEIFVKLNRESVKVEYCSFQGTLEKTVSLSVVKLIGINIVFFL